jgi:hypothetical protein
VDWKKLVKDKRVWIAGGVAGALGLAVFLRRGSATGGQGDAATPGTAAPPAGYYQGSGNTSGTDIAAFLSSWAQSNQAQQKDFYDSTLEALKQGQTTPDTGELGGPMVIYSKGPGGDNKWALINSPLGIGWMETNNQATANQWAAQYGGTSQTAQTVDSTAWQKLMAKWNK